MDDALAKWLANPGAVTGSAVLAFACWMFFTGKLIPLVVHTNALAQKDLLIASKDIIIAKLERDRDEFKQMALRALTITERTQLVSTKREGTDA